MKVLLTPAAKKDILAIRDYSTAKADDPGAGKNLVVGILTRLDELKDFPKMGARLSSLLQIKSQYRYLVCKGGYLVFYKEEKGSIRVYRILNSRTDYIANLIEDLK